jgi:hypothetical protein
MTKMCRPGVTPPEDRVVRTPPAADMGSTIVDTRLGCREDDLRPDVFPSDHPASAHAPCGFGWRIIQDVPNLSLSIAKRVAKKVSSIGMKIWPPSESRA